MAEYSEITLVDGVGRPKVLTIRKEHVSPITVQFPHPTPGEQGSQVIIKFDRSNNEYDPYGRQVYRQRCLGEPTIRAEYLIRHAAKSA